MRKLLLVSVLILLTFWLRLAFLQLDQGGKYAEWSKQITLRKELLLAPRGVITDRHGKALAENRPIFAAYLERDHLAAPSIEAWAELLGLPQNELEEKMQAAKKTPAYLPFLLTSDLSLEQLSALRNHQVDDEIDGTTHWQGLELRLGSVRSYGGLHSDQDSRKALSHLLGYVRSVTEKDLLANSFLSLQDLIGASGVERAFDEHLRGKNGYALRWVDAHGRPMDTSRHPELSPYEIAPVAGSDLQLSIDSRLQEHAYQLFSGRRGALVALHLPDGEVLSMVSSPGYDNAAFIGGIRSSLWQALNHDPLHPLFDRAVQGTYPPASTYKIVTAAAALEADLIHADESHSCSGGLSYGKRRFRCWNKGGHGRMTLVNAIEASCDVFFYKVGLSLDVDLLAQMAKRFGFGAKTALAFPSEQAGFIPTRHGVQKILKREWNKGDILSVAIGQGVNLVTPLQSAVAIARFASNSELDPQLSHHPTASRTRKTLLSPDHQRVIAEGLRRVVAGGSGTARSLQGLPFTVAGKTGTAQTSGTEGDHAWFIAYAPVESPEIALSVVVEHGGHGGAVAAPIVRNYLADYFENGRTP